MSQKSVSAESMLFNVGAETGVLGGLMLDNDRWDEIAPILNCGDFYYGQHQPFQGNRASGQCRPAH